MESQTNEKIYFLIEKLFLILSNKVWLINYIFWELEFFKAIGYDLEIDKHINTQVVGNKITYYVYSSKTKKIVPTFLVEKKFNELEKENLIKGLNIVNDFLNKSILIPNNIKFPKLRSEFLNLINK